MKIACIIPARLASTRFPKKVLATLGAKPLLQWVWEAANQCPQFDEVSFAIDAEETAALISSFGGRFFRTSKSCVSGTDRLIELRQKEEIKADIWVNWQGDEPFIQKGMITDLLQTVEEKKFDIWSLKTAIKTERERLSPEVVKVVTSSNGKALYFSRAQIPYCQNGILPVNSPYFKHVGLYAFTESALHFLSLCTPTMLEQSEQLEQLRFLEHGLNMQVHSTSFSTLAIDKREDLALAEEWIARNFSKKK